MILTEPIESVPRFSVYATSVKENIRKSIIRADKKRSTGAKFVQDNRSLDHWTKHNPLLMAEEIYLDSHVGTWHHQTDFLLTYLAFSVGLGNLWRFPFVAITRGTYAFMLAYIIIVLLVVMPLMFLEVYIGQFTSRGIGGCWHLAPGFFGIGITMIILNVIYSIYYNVVLGWILFYAISSMRLDKSTIPFMSCDNIWNDDTCQTTANRNFTGKSVKGEPASLQFWYRFVTLIQDQYGNSTNSISFVPGYITWYTCTCTLLSYTLCGIVMMRSSNLYLHKFHIIIFALFVIIVITYGMSFIFSSEGAAALKYWYYTFKNITNPAIWCDAMVQACFSFGIGFGNILNLRRHSQFHHKISLLLISGVLLNLFVAIIYTMKISVNIGIINLHYNISVEKSSPLNLLGLVLISIGEYYSESHQQLYCITYYLFLFLVSFKTLHFTLDTAISGLIDVFPILANTKYHKLCFIFFFIYFSSWLSLFLVTRCGYQWLKWLFIYATSSNILIVTVLQMVIFIYLYGIDKIDRDCNMMLSSNVNPLFRYHLRIAPFIIIFVVFLEWISAIWTNYDVGMFHNDLPIWAKYLGFSFYFVILLPIPFVFIREYRHTHSKSSHLETVKKLLQPDIKWGPLKKSNWLYDDDYRSKLMVLRDLNLRIKRRESLDTILCQPNWLDERLISSGTNEAASSVTDGSQASRFDELEDTFKGDPSFSQALVV